MTSFKERICARSASIGFAHPDAPTAIVSPARRRGSIYPGSIYHRGVGGRREARADARTVRGRVDLRPVISGSGTIASRRITAHQAHAATRVRRGDGELYLPETIRIERSGNWITKDRATGSNRQTAGDFARTVVGYACSIKRQDNGDNGELVKFWD